MDANGYKVAVGYDQVDALASMSDAATKLENPRVEQWVPGRITASMDTDQVVDGYWRTALVYDQYLDSSRLTVLYTKLGLAETESSEITICLPGRTRVWEFWNAKVYRVDTAYHTGRFDPTEFPLVLIEHIP